MSLRLIRRTAAFSAAFFIISGAFVTPIASAQELPCAVYCRRGCIQQFGLPQNNPAYQQCFDECILTDCMAA
ncbi:hypothetical protein N0B44_08655 [Roseibacterium beibuensis]|uniref:hypothetical protein n=1 Tax=[Roseibacterium] beibuensis TaxID=1193142 RepID=UPI00217D6F53|nr:hypothetical protein [Roseibacterium beibuensis]MCS6622977.1 hypothetical protein [Roseibacterium beibuensis]